MCNSIDKMECVKTKDVYIYAAIELIKNDADKSNVAMELANHIDDRIQYYMDIGFDAETAAQKAVEQMGDPESIAAPLSQLHPKGRMWTAVLAVLTFAIVLFFFGYYAIFMVAEGNMGFGIAECIALLNFIGISLLGKKRRSNFLCELPTVLFAITYVGYAILAIIKPEASICSSIVLDFFCLITGDFACLGTYPTLGMIKVAPWLTCVSCAFYILIFILLIFTVSDTNKLCELTYTLANKKRSRRVSFLQKSILVFSALVVLISCFCAQPEKNLKSLGCEPAHFDTVVILQSDRPCSAEEVEKEDILILYSSWSIFSQYIHGWGTPVSDTRHTVDIDEEYVAVAYGRKLEYGVQKYTMYAEITKPYLYIGFADGRAYIDLDNISDYITLTEDDWQETESTEPMRAAVDSFNCVEVVVNAD